jgi:CelD/BcsL family acetyltransferase involved in cellulose biosynthesis
MPMVETRPKLEVERVEARDALKSIGAAWDRLLDQNETRMAELTHSWQMTYWDHLADDSQLFLLVVREAGEIVAIAPLKLCKIRKLGIPIRYLEFIAAEESNFQDFIIGRRREEVLLSILEFLMRHRSQWDVLYMRNLPEQATTARFFLDVPGRLDPSVDSNVVGVRRCIYMDIDKTWKQYRENSAKMRNKIASKKRKLQKVGAITYFHCFNGKDFETNLPRFFDLHRRRWNGTDTPSQFHDERHCRFYLEAGLRLLPKKQIDLFMFELDDKPIAGLLTLRYDRGCVQQITAYDPAHAHASPSLVMHEIFVEELFANGMQRFDFGNYYPYKETWANSFKNTLDIKIHLGGLIPRYDHLASTMLQGLRGRIRKHDNMRKAARFVRRRFRMRQTPKSHGTGV